MIKEALTIEIENVKEFIDEKTFDTIKPEVFSAFEMLHKKSGPGNEYLGWLDLPFNIPESEIQAIEKLAVEIRQHADVFVNIGIGGSYLGARAVIDALSHHFSGQLDFKPKIYFAGQNISSDYLYDLIEMIRNKNVCLSVVSKSGTTTEPAIAFRILKGVLEKEIGSERARHRIIATTDREKGALRRLAEIEGYRTLTIPGDIGGRFSVLTPVGLLPIAVSGIDIREILKGARHMAELSQANDPLGNPCMVYASIRNLLYRQGKSIEVLASFEPALHFIGEWWKQLFGESEGKNGKGIFPASADFSTDLHSMGQLIQDGARNIFETFLIVEKAKRTISIQSESDDFDGLNFLGGKTLEFINMKAYEGTALAHRTGAVPNLTIRLPALTPYWMGQLLYFFEISAALSGYILGVNPFDQPGVEMYKRNMFRLLGKPGF
ncbi:glucose-6-phosphate isomerase [candidate division KSB1 bacterium]|nr:glucose-6-phosphate isomerase [candidate division KSB1 bacterium]